MHPRPQDVEKTVPQPSFTYLALFLDRIPQRHTKCALQFHFWTCSSPPTVLCFCPEQFYMLAELCLPWSFRQTSWIIQIKHLLQRSELICTPPQKVQSISISLHFQKPFSCSRIFFLIQVRSTTVFELLSHRRLSYFKLKGAVLHRTLFCIEHIRQRWLQTRTFGANIG